MSDNLDVAIITSGYFPVPPAKGGAVENLVQELADMNEQYDKLNLTIYSCDDDEAEKIANRYHNVKYVFVKTPAFIQWCDKVVYAIAKNVLNKQKHMSYRYILQRLHYIKKVGKLINAANHDRIIIENHPTLLGVFDVADNQHKYHDKYIYHMHNAVSSMFGHDKTMMDCHRIIAVSQYVIGDFCNGIGENFDIKKTAIFRNRVDEHRFTGKISLERAAEMKSKLNISDNAKIMLFGGRLNQEKGALELIKAFSKIKNENAILLIAGSYYYGTGMHSDYEEQLHEAAQALGNRIIFTGFVLYEEMPDYYALADVVCVPSVWQDSAPLSVIEPLTAKKPVITTNMGGIPEYAHDGINAVVLDTKDNEHFIDNLADAIDDVLDGKIQLHPDESIDWTEKGYYDDFIQLIQ